MSFEAYLLSRVAALDVADVAITLTDLKGAGGRKEWESKEGEEEEDDAASVHDCWDW